MRKIVAGWIEREGKVLLGLRPEGYWEFPGGVVEEGEREEEALRRELREELGIEVRVGERLSEVKTEEGILILFQCFLLEGLPYPHFHRKICWMDKEKLKDFPLGEWDRELLAYFPES